MVHSFNIKILQGSLQGWALSVSLHRLMIRVEPKNWSSTLESMRPPPTRIQIRLLVWARLSLRVSQGVPGWDSPAGTRSQAGSQWPPASTAGLGMGASGTRTSNLFYSRAQESIERSDCEKNRASRGAGRVMNAFHPVHRGSSRNRSVGVG